jgi:hypothetical protein
MDDVLAVIRTASLVAFGVAVVVLGVAWQPWRRGKPLAGGLWGSALALGGAYLAGQLLIDSWPASFVAAKDKVLNVVGVATLLGLLYSLLPPPLASWRLRAAPVLALLIYLFEVQITQAGVRWLAYLTVGGVVFWWLLDDIAERAPGPSAPLVLIPPVAASAPILFWPGQTTIPFCLAPLLVALGVCVIVGFIDRSFSLARGGTTVMALLLIAVWLIGYLLTDVKPLYLLLLAVPMAAVWLTCLGPFRRMPWWSAVLLRFVLVAAPAAVAVKLAYDNRPQDEYDPYAAHRPVSRWVLAAPSAESAAPGRARLVTASRPTP